jgi:predicted site-specific integrase-resolvase
MLNSLSNKFPNISIFKERLEAASELKKTSTDIASRLNDEDMKLFEAMELMQFHDINRQKIERVMSIIRKLTTYLNNLFEEDEGYEEIAIAKHIHGDDASDLVSSEDMDALIAEFSK